MRVLQRASRQAEELAAIPLADQIDWEDIIGTAVDALPASAFVAAVTFAADTPTSAVAQLTEPFTAPRIGVIELNLQATSLDELTDWLDRMRRDPAFSDVSMYTVEVVEGWTAMATLSLAPSLTAVSPEEAAE